MAIVAHDVGYQFNVIFGYGCPFPFAFKDIERHAASRCKDVDQNLLQEKLLQSLHNSDLLVVRLYLPKSQYLTYKANRLPPVDAYDSAISKLIRAVRRKSANLLLVGPNPTLTPEQLAALSKQWFTLSEPPSKIFIHSSDNKETAYYHLLDGHLKKFLASTAGASYFSLNSYLCNAEDNCRLADGNNRLYNDEQHITSYAYDLFFDELLDRVRQIVSAPSVRALANEVH